MNTINEQFFSKGKALAFMHGYLNEFRPATYGTRLTVRQTRCCQYWECVGSRFAN